MKSKCKPKYAAKGLPKVPGKPKGTDIIPAWLTPGEAVLSPGAAEMLGRGNVQALNRQANHMRLGSQYKALGDEDMQPEIPDLAGMGNARAEEILANPDQFTPEEVQMAKIYMDPRGLAGGPSQERDMQFLQGTRGLDQMQQSMEEEPQYFMGGTGMVLGMRPQYYAVGSAYAGMGAQNVLEDALRNQGMMRNLSDSRSLVPAGPRVSMPTGSLGEGQGIRVQQNALGTKPVSIPSSFLPQAPQTPVDSMAAKMGQYSATPSRLTDPIARKMASASIPAQPPITSSPVSPMTSEMSKFSATPARLTDPIAQKMASASYTPPVTTPLSSGSRMALNAVDNLSRNLNTIPTGIRAGFDVKDALSSKLGPATGTLAAAESIGNAAVGALSDRFGKGREAVSAVSAPLMAASGYRPVTGFLNKLGMDTPLSQVERFNEARAPNMPGKPMTDEQAQNFINDPYRQERKLNLGASPARQADSSGMIGAANAAPRPDSGNAMAPVSSMGPPAPADGPTLMGGTNLYANRASAVAGERARANEPGYITRPSPNFPGGTQSVVTKPTTMDEFNRNESQLRVLAKQGDPVAMRSLGMNLSQSQLGNPVTRPSQSVQQMTQPILGQGIQPSQKYLNANPSDITMQDRIRNGDIRLTPMSNEEKAYNEYVGRQNQLMDVVQNSMDPERIRAAASGLGGAYNFNPGFPNGQLDYSAKMSELGANQGLRDAQSQAFLARAQNDLSEADVNRSMAANPQAYTGMRLGGMRAGGRGQSDATQGLRYERLPGGEGAPDIPAIVDIGQGTYRQLKPVLDDSETSLLDSIRQQYPGAKESDIKRYILNLRNPQMTAQ